MKLFNLPLSINRFLEKKQFVFWFSSTQLFFSWDKKKKQISLNTDAGFLAGQIADEQQAVRTLTEALTKEGINSDHPLAKHTATVFVTTASSPLERDITRRVFKKAGFVKVSLVTYATALKSFAERQNIHTGVGFYFGSDVSEAIVFSPKEQAAFSLNYSLMDIQSDLRQLLRERQRIEVSLQAARKLYLSLGKNNQSTIHNIRGRNIQTQQVETRTLVGSDLEKIRAFFQTKLVEELRVLIFSSLFEEINPDHWVVVGDGFLNDFVQQKYQAKTLFLKSEIEMIQGVEWL